MSVLAAEGKIDLRFGLEFKIYISELRVLLDLGIQVDGGHV